jgi:hypothetical protein
MFIRVSAYPLRASVSPILLSGKGVLEALRAGG